MLTINLETARRFILGKQGLWPGRRWRGLKGTQQAMRAMEYLQLDPLQIIARSQDITLHSRVLDYSPGMWEAAAYQQRKFFDWGGWLATRPMDELLHWRVIMRREREGGALALYYLWRTGEVMTHHRENFERVYALTEAVAPAHLLRKSDEAEADRFLIKKEVSFSGPSRLNRTADAFFSGVPFSKAKQIREAMLADGDIIEVEVEGWKVVHYALGSDAKALRDLSAGRVLKAWTPLETTTAEEVVFLAPLDHVSARGRAKVLYGFDCVWEVYKPEHQHGSATTRCRFCGATGASRVWKANSTGRPTRSSSWACGWKIRPSAKMKPLRRHWLAGLRASSLFSARASWMSRRFVSRCCADTHALQRQRIRVGFDGDVSPFACYAY
jgi:uncharacterized protein YcaQ